MTTDRLDKGILIGTRTNAAIRKAIAERLASTEPVDPRSCPPRLRQLIDQLRQQDEQQPNGFN